MLGHDELDIEERIAAPVTLDAFEDFIDWHQIRDYELSPGSLPLLLGWDMRRQFGEAGFPVWRDLMHLIEPPLLAESLLGPGDPRTPCTTAEYEAALVDDWAAFDRPHHWTDCLIVDQMAAAQREGWEPCAGEEVNAAIEAVLDDLARRSGAKRAVIQAESDAREAAETAEIRAEQNAEFAVYEAWLAAGEPATAPLADEHRARKQRIGQARIEADHRAIDEWLDEQYAANEIGDDVPSDDPRFAAYVKRSDEIAAEHKAKIAEWEARHGGLPAIRQLFMADRRIPPGTSVYAMEKLSLLFTLPDSVVKMFADNPIQGAPISLSAIPNECHEAMRWLTQPLQWVDMQGNLVNSQGMRVLDPDIGRYVDFDPYTHCRSQPIDLRGMPMPTPPQLSIVPAEPAPDYLTSSRDFMATFEPPEYLIDGMLQVRYFYSLTAGTGVGKTAIAMRLAGHVVLGKPIGDREVQQGDVLYLAGENPADVQYRWLALSRDMGIDPETEHVTWMVGAKDLAVAGQTMVAEAARKGKAFKLIVVDTAAAYNFGDNENDNSQAGAYARQLRSLVNMPGGPCVLVLCHPTKRAADDDLMPRGGGAFIAEVDGNMAVMKKEGLLAVVPFGKFRGDMSWSQHYELEKIEDHPKLKDARGRQMASIIARPIASTSAEIKARNGHNDGITLLHAVFDHPASNATELARHLNWTYGKAAEPHKNKVNRLMESLVAQKLVRETMGRWKITSKGQEALNDADTAAARAPRPMFPIPGVNT